MYLAHPRLRDLPVGSKEWFAAQQQMIQAKPLVKRCYDLWYKKLLADADTVPGHSTARTVELGSGSSYIKRLRPAVISSDVVPGGADIVIDGQRLPFREGSVRALLLSHVFHHIPNIASFLEEALRVLVPGGVISMIEVTHTPFARFFFSTFHPEPYDDEAREWNFQQEDSMLDSNQALSWIVFFRDRQRFARQFPTLKLEHWSYLPWLSYLLSGGVNLRSFVPRPAAPAFRLLDSLLRPVDPIFAIHWHLRLRKSTGHDGQLC